MSNLKLVAGTVKRRGIAIAAAVAVAGGSLATANYAMAVEEELTFEKLQQEFQTTEAGKPAAKSANDAANAIKSGQPSAEVQRILKEGLAQAAAAGDAGFDQKDLDSIDPSELEAQLKAIAESGQQTWEKKSGIPSERPSSPSGPEAHEHSEPGAPTQSPAPAHPTNHSMQRLEAEFGNSQEGKIAEETVKLVVEVLRTTGNKQEIEKAVRDGLKKVGFGESEIDQHQSEIDEIIGDTFRRHNEANVLMQEHKESALEELALLDNLNPLQRDIFKKQIQSADKMRTVDVVLGAARAEDKNPVAPFAPVPGQKAPEKNGDETDVEKALAHTKQEALKKIEGFTFLTEQQKEAYKKQVEAATQVFEVEETFESGEAKNTVNKAAKEAKNFVGKAVARTKQLALKQLDEMKNLTHEQKKETRNKIVAADQVYQVEAAFHAAEKLNKAAKK